MKSIKSETKVESNFKSKINHDEDNNTLQASTVNEQIFIKIVNSLEEFEQGYQTGNILGATNPKFSNQVFGEEEKVEGYTNLKIILFLTPLTWSPCFKVSYDSKESNAESIRDLFNKFYFDESYYNEDPQVFKEALKRDLETKKIDIPDLSIIESSIIGNFDIRVQVFPISIEQRSHVLHRNLQSLIHFFIDAASEIPLVYGFWNYYIISKVDISSQQEHLIGFCTVSRFHISKNTYRAMISQFFIAPGYQRNGYGLNLLTSILSNETRQTECVDISTEDPSDEFMYLRDVAMFKCHLKYFINRIDNRKQIINEEDYHKISIQPNELISTAESMKLSIILTKRLEIIVKFILISGEKSIDDLLFDDINAYLVELNNQFYFNQHEGRNPIIFFDERKEFNAAEILKGQKPLSIEEMQVNLQESLDEFNKDLSEIRKSCLKVLNNLK